MKFLFLDHKNFTSPLQNNGRKCFFLSLLEIFLTFSHVSSREVKKMQVNETNNFKIYLYVCIKFFLYKILFWQLKLMSIITIFTIKITFKKLSKMLFIVEKNLFCPKDFQTFVVPSSSLFFFLGRYWFYRRNWFIINSKAYGIIMSLNWNSKTQIF